VAHSSQQTSTVLPPIRTWMALPSSSQSQAAQVLSLMAVLHCPQAGQRDWTTAGVRDAVSNFSD
jgi:hypothetical protein